MRENPEFGRGIVDERKLVAYLLSSEHPTGRAKARFFLALGFRRDRPEELERALLRHARENGVAARELSEFGSKYVVDGPIESPSGKRPRVCAIGFVAKAEEVPRFVTAYPSSLSGREKRSPT